MKQKPPHYTLDTETRRFVELVAYWARQLESVQQPSTHNDMLRVIQTVESRLGLTPPEPDEPAEVVQLRPFRVVTTSKSEHKNEPR